MSTSKTTELERHSGCFDRAVAAFQPLVRNIILIIFAYVDSSCRKLCCLTAQRKNLRAEIISFCKPITFLKHCAVNKFAQTLDSRVSSHLGSLRMIFLMVFAVSVCFSSLSWAGFESRVVVAEA